MIEAYPLCWPVGRPRSKTRARAAFSRGGRALGINDGLDRLLPELERLGGKNVVVSTNVPVARDGLPNSNARAPEDPGVAVYFTLSGHQHCISCDRWDRVADNLAAIAAHVEAVRGQLRWGAADVAQAFAGFKALPAPGATRPWWQVLGVPKDASAAAIKAKYRELAARHHPDRGGHPDQMAEVNAAFDEARRAGVVT